MNDNDVAYLLAVAPSAEAAGNCPRQSLLDDTPNHRLLDGRTSGKILGTNPRKCEFRVQFQWRFCAAKLIIGSNTVRLFLAAGLALPRPGWPAKFTSGKQKWKCRLFLNALPT